MTRERLRQVESLLLELEEERERFSREKRHRERMEISYGVGCLFGERPFEDARNRLRRIEAQIDSVSDSMTRRALRLRYLDGKSWGECARRMGYADESGPRKLVERYMRMD